MVCGGRARGQAPLGGVARVPWGPTHGLGRVRRGVVGPGSARQSAAAGRGSREVYYTVYLAVGIQLQYCKHPFGPAPRIFWTYDTVTRSNTSTAFV